MIQVVDAEQRVVAGSATADRLTPLLRPDELQRALAGEALVVSGVRLGRGRAAAGARGLGRVARPTRWR